MENWKIQLTVPINLISSNNSDETRNMRTKNDNIEIMMGSETDEIIVKLFKSLLRRYQERLEELIKRSEFIFDRVVLLYYHFQKISMKRTRSSYIDSPKRLKNKKATTNPKNNDDNCFQYSTNAALNQKHNKYHPERIFNLKLFIDQYDWKVIDFPAQPSKDWKQCESNNK